MERKNNRQSSFKKLKRGPTVQIDEVDKCLSRRGTVDADHADHNDDQEISEQESQPPLRKMITDMTINDDDDADADHYSDVSGSDTDSDDDRFADPHSHDDDFSDLNQEERMLQQ